MNKRDLMIGTILALALGACSRQSAADADLAEVEASMEPSPVATLPAAPQPVKGVEPTMLSPDAVAVGSAVARNGAVATPKTVFAAGDTVYMSVVTAGRPQGAEVVTYWFGPGGHSVKEERKLVGAGAEYVNFSLNRADGMTTGAYMVQVDVAGKPLGMADFTVR